MEGDFGAETLALVSLPLLPRLRRAFRAGVGAPRGKPPRPAGIVGGKGQQDGRVLLKDRDDIRSGAEEPVIADELLQRRPVVPDQEHAERIQFGVQRHDVTV